MKALWWHTFNRGESPFDAEEWDDFDEKEENDDLDYSLLFFDMSASSFQIGEDWIFIEFMDLKIFQLNLLIFEKV